MKAEARNSVEEALVSLRKWIEGQDFKGWDPYDALNSPFPFHRFGKWGEVLAIQAFKRSPVNFRPLFGVKKELNPKALGLLLESYSMLWARGDADAGQTARSLFEELRYRLNPAFSGACWGYPFPWSGPSKRLPAHYPSSVVTAAVVRGLHTYYEVSRHPLARELILSARDFVLRDLHRWEDGSGLCFSYTPAARDICYNASLFASEVLARAMAMGADEEDKELIGKAVEFVLARQKDDGRWLYSQDPLSGRERSQIDFHQGFILDSLQHIIRFTGLREAAWDEAIRKGAMFYRQRQFTPQGRSLRRLPRKWPADIHAQAQGIITFSLLGADGGEHHAFAQTIADWTVCRMRSSEGWYHYQRYPLGSIRIPYMRWGQAWMMRALVGLGKG